LQGNTLFLCGSEATPNYALLQTLLFPPSFSAALDVPNAGKADGDGHGQFDVLVKLIFVALGSDNLISHDSSSFFERDRFHFVVFGVLICVSMLVVPQPIGEVVVTISTKQSAHFAQKNDSCTPSFAKRKAKE
jgi:hypothetical protein